MCQTWDNFLVELIHLRCVFDRAFFFTWRVTKVHTGAVVGEMTLLFKNTLKGGSDRSYTVENDVWFSKILVD